MVPYCPRWAVYTGILPGEFNGMGMDSTLQHGVESDWDLKIETLAQKKK